MADRSWNGIDARLFDEFAAVASVVLSILIARCPNEHGVYDLPAAYLERFVQALQAELQDQTPAAIVAAALENLETAGTIRRYPDRSLWLVKKFKRSKCRGFSKNINAALQHVAEHHTDVLADFKALYCDDSPDCEAPTVPTVAGKGGDCRGATVPTTDPDPEPEVVVQQRLPTPRKAAAPRTAASKRQQIKQQPPSEPALALAETMERDIRSLEAAGHPIADGWRRQPVQIARSLDLAKVNLAVCAEAWAWGLGQSFWQPQLLQQASWAKEPNRWVSLVNQYLARAKRPSERDVRPTLADAEIAQ